MNNKTKKSAMDKLLTEYAQTLYVPTKGIGGKELYLAYKDFKENDFVRFGKLTVSDKLAVVWMYAQVKYKNVQMRRLTLEERIRFNPDELFQTKNPNRYKNYEPYLDFFDLVAGEG